MTAVSTNSPLCAIFPSAPSISFYEFRSPEVLVVNPVFVKKAYGQWEYLCGKSVIKITLPSWDKAFDWDAHYSDVSKRHKPSSLFDLVFLK